MDEHDLPRRAARADLHLLPPGAGHRGAGRAHAADARRAHDRRDRPRLPRARGDDGPAAGAGQAQDPGGRHPVPRAARAPAARAARRGARRRLPDLQRGLRRAATTWPAEALWLGRGAGRAAARRARGARPAGADAAARLPPRRALPSTASWCCWPTRTGRCGTTTRSRGAGPRSTGPSRSAGRGPYVVQAAIASLHADDPPDWHQIAAALRRARPAHRLARGRAEPRRRRRRGRGAGGGAGASSTGSPSTTTATCTRRGPSCCAGSTAPTRRATPTAGRSS